MTRDDPPLRIRLPEGLKEQIKLLALANHRSMNAEIVARLEHVVATEHRGVTQVEPEMSIGDADFERRLQNLETRMRIAERKLANF